MIGGDTEGSEVVWLREPGGKRHTWDNETIFDWFEVIPLDLHLSALTGRAHLRFLRENLVRAFTIIKPPLRELSLALVDSRTMSRLHWDFMKIKGPTDVLTFELDHDPKGRVLAGEVIVCLPYARTIAKREKIPLRNELLLYALHGMLHLCGFDDRTDREFARMHRREDQVLQALGIGAVFARPIKKGNRS